MDARALSAYLPRLVRRHLARHPDQVGRTLCSGWAAVLLTDMQGFTRKVEEAEAGGRNGLDAFTRVLDGYFGDLIDRVHTRGGDILAFAGDSMLCAWFCDDDGDSLRRATLAAADAGQQIQQALAGREPTRIGLGAGPIACTLAGGHLGRWELFATGEAVAGAAETERQGLPGQVVLTQAAWQCIQGDASAALLANGFYVLGRLHAPLPPQPPADDEACADTARISPMLPPAVIHHVFAGQAQWLSELRPVSSLVVGLPGLSVPSPESLEQTQRGVHAVQEIVREFGGGMRCVIDGKGHLIGGDFGLPPGSPERHAELAVRAGRRIQQALQALRMNCSIGIASARAVCMGFGNAYRRDFGVFGDASVLATRLMQSAGDDIWCDEVTMRAAAGRLSFEPLPPLAVKGRGQDVRVYRPVEPAAATATTPSPPTRMVGRDHERMQLVARLDALERGRGGVVLIDGEAGSGKTLLLAEGARLAARRGLRVLQGEADVVDRATPYLAWRPIFRQLLEIPPGLDGAQVPQRIVERFAEALGIFDYLPLLGPVLGVSIPDSARTRALTGEVRATSTHRTMRTVLEYFAKDAPLVLTLEDAHWLDSGAIGFLRWLVRRPGMILVLVSARPEQPFFERLRASLAGPMLHTIRLSEMGDEELQALARQVLGANHVPSDLQALLRRSVGGNPYFCCELVRALVLAGRIRVDKGFCEVLDLSASDVPATLESVILGRLARLAPAEQFCLKAASVLGPSFREETLRAIHPVDQEREQVAQRLAPAESGGLICIDPDSPDRSWTFRHAIVRDAAYALWTQAQRQPLHRAVATWYETRFANDLPPLYTLLAHHWDEAGEAATAAGYLERAGQQALRAGAYQEARRLFCRVLELAHDNRLDAPPSRRARWHAGAGMAHYFLGELDRSQQQLEAAVTLLDRPVPPTLARTRGRVLGAIGEQTLHLLRPARYGGQREPQQADIEAAVECYSKLSQIYYLNGEPAERLLAVNLAGLNLGEQGRPSAALARVLSGSAILAALTGLDRLADRYAARAVAIAERPECREAAAHVWHFRAILCAQRGHWAAARDANDRALHLIRELGDQTLEAEASVVRSTFLLCQGSYLEASQAWSRGLHLARRAGNPQVECWCLLDSAETHLGRGELAAAHETLEQALRIPTRPTDGYSTLEKQRMLALVRLHQGRPQEALEACDAVYGPVHSQPPAGYHWADFYASAVEVVLRLIERDDHFARQHRAGLLRRARQGVQMLRKLARRFGNVRVRVRLLSGVLQWVEGHRQRALQEWNDALALADALTMPGERMRVLVELASHGQLPDDATRQVMAQWLDAHGALELLGRFQRASSTTQDRPA